MPEAAIEESPAAVAEVMPVAEPVAKPAPMPEPTRAADPLETLDDDVIKRLEQAIAAEPEVKRKPSLARPVTDKKPFNAKPFKIAAPLLAACWIVAAFFANVPDGATASVVGPIYRLFGASNTEGLAFADVAMEREQNGGKAKFILSGSIHNNASEERLVPTVRVVLKNKTDDVLWGREYPVKKMLKAGEVYPFKITNVETAFASSVARIEVDMGSNLALMVR